MKQITPAEKLLQEIKGCSECAAHLPLGPRPVLQFSANSKILIIGQAPGKSVHETGIAWNDKSGDNLRSWLGVTPEEFYSADYFALVPMGFCYPGKGKNGDLPPRPECAPLWHNKIMTLLQNVQITILIGQFSQKYYLCNDGRESLTENIRQFRQFLPRYFPLPHPSPRNNIWQAKHPWFKKDVIPELQNLVARYIRKKK